MIPRVKSVIPLDGFRIFVTFNDGAEGEVDIGKALKFRGVLAKLAEPEFFNRVHVARTYKTVTWPGQLDLDPVMLYHRATGKSIEWILDQDDPPKPKRMNKTQAARTVI